MTSYFVTLLSLWDIQKYVGTMFTFLRIQPINLFYQIFKATFTAKNILKNASRFIPLFYRKMRRRAVE